MAERSQTVITVSELNNYVKMLLENNKLLTGLYVRGEISNFKNHYSTGHLYFSLKDADGVISGVMFRSDAIKLAFKPQEGMKVMVHGRVSLYPKTGTYQIYVDEMIPDGIGSLYVAFLQLKDKLEKEGLFDQSRKRTLPFFPKQIGVITSPTGAAIQDMFNIIGRRYPLAQVNLYPALVQGMGAASSLCEGMQYFESHPGLADVIIIGRGGGSIEDLWAFNDERLARLIAASPVPVVSAVGHETDFTICDFVADLRAPTPSAAAELVVPNITELYKYFADIQSRFTSAMLQSVTQKRIKLQNLTDRRVLQTPMAALDEKRMQLDYATDRLVRLQDKIVQLRKQTIAKYEATLEALSPISVLNRGYSMLLDSNGSVIKSVKDVHVEDVVKARLADGSVDATIKAIN